MPVGNHREIRAEICLHYLYDHETPHSLWYPDFKDVSEPLCPNCAYQFEKHENLERERNLPAGLANLNLNAQSAPTPEYNLSGIFAQLDFNLPPVPEILKNPAFGPTERQAFRELRARQAAKRANLVPLPERFVMSAKSVARYKATQAKGATQAVNTIPQLQSFDINAERVTSSTSRAAQSDIVIPLFAQGDINVQREEGKRVTRSAPQAVRARHAARNKVRSAWVAYKTKFKKETGLICEVPEVEGLRDMVRILERCRRRLLYEKDMTSITRPESYLPFHELVG